MRKHVCELSGDIWTPAELRMLPLERDNWYLDSELDDPVIQSASATDSPTLFGLEGKLGVPGSRWLPIQPAYDITLSQEEYDLLLYILDGVDYQGLNEEYGGFGKGRGGYGYWLGMGLAEKIKEGGK